MDYEIYSFSVVYYHNVQDYDKLCHSIHVLKIKDAEQLIKTVKKINR